VIIRKEKESIIRGLSIFLILMFGLIYLNQSPYRNTTVGWIADQLFPQRALNYEYYVERGSNSKGRYVRYVFVPPRPKLRLEMSGQAKYLHLNNPRSLNKVLRYIDLPPVDSGAPELSSLTGSSTDANDYRWPGYSIGPLTVTRGLCRNTDAPDAYHCLIRITIITQPY